MFGNDGPPFPILSSREDASPVGQDPRSLVARLALLAKKRRNNDNTPTADVQAAFKEGERAPVAGASI